MGTWAEKMVLRWGCEWEYNLLWMNYDNYVAPSRRDISGEWWQLSRNRWTFEVGAFLQLTGGIIPKMGFILVVRPPDWFQITPDPAMAGVFPGRPQRKSSNTRNSPGEEKTGMTCGATINHWKISFIMFLSEMYEPSNCPRFKFLVCFFQYSLSFSA